MVALHLLVFAGVWVWGRELLIWCLLFKQTWVMEPGTGGAIVTPLISTSDLREELDVNTYFYNTYTILIQYLYNTYFYIRSQGGA